MKYVVILVFSIFSLYAHQLRENYLRIYENNATDGIRIELEIETRLFENDTIDDNHNSIISFKELKAHQDELMHEIRSKVHFFYNRKELPLADATVTFHRYKTQTYMQIEKKFSDITLEGLELKYTLFFDLENNHKLLIHLDEKNDAIVDTNHRIYRFVPSKMTHLERFFVFCKEGIEHIIDGTDHLLFVLMLLVPSMILYRQSIYSFKESMLSLFKIITTFSIAHSVTLFISGMHWYIPNTVFVESMIGLSIFVVAGLNFFQKYTHVSYGIVFLFGLIHGFGFANVLEIAQVKDSFSFVIALFGFNIGVEIGQIGVIACMLPFLFVLIRQPYALRVFGIIEVVTMGISVFWFLQRINVIG